MIFSTALRSTIISVALISLILVGGCVDTASHEIDLKLYSGQWSDVESGMQIRLQQAESDAGEMIITEGELSLEMAISRAILNDGELAALAAQMQAENIDAISASKMPNPDVRVTVEDIAGSGSMSGTDSMDNQLRVRQKIELGGKGAARKRMGELKAAITGSRRGVRRLELTLSTSRAFYGVLAAEKFANSAKTKVDTLSELLQELKNLGGMEGADTEVISRCELLLAESRAELTRAKIVEKNARAKLAASWGDLRVSFDKISGSLALSGKPAELDQLASRLEGAPDVYEFEAEYSLCSAQRSYAELEKIPDIEVLGGVRREDSSGDHGFFAGVEVELPISSWSGHDARAASRRAVAAQARKRAMIARASVALTEAHGKLSEAYAVAVSLRDELLPAASAAIDGARISQANGAENPWNIARAIDDKYDIENDYISALLDYHIARLEVERITAGKSTITEIPAE